MGDGKRRRRGPDFRDDLLRGIHAQPGDLGQPLHRRLVRAEETRHLLVELHDVVVDHAQFIEREVSSRR